MLNAGLDSQNYVETRKKLALLKFTQELIMNSGDKEIFQLKRIVKEKILQKIKREDFQKEIGTLQRLTPPIFYKVEQKEEIKEDEEKPFELKQTTKPLVQSKRRDISQLKSNVEPKRERYTPQSLPQIKIPETRLPPNFEYLRPSPTNEEINLQKLNPLVKDALVKVIECTGADQSIIVSGGMGRKPTNIKLSEQEIQEVLKSFSAKSKIPLTKGVFKIAVGQLILSAITSEVVGSKFVIKKMESTQLRPPIRN